MGRVILPHPPSNWFSLKNSKTVKTVTLEFAAFSNILSETLVPNLVSIARPSLQILGKAQKGIISDFRMFGQSLIKENCHNYRASDDIFMKLGPVTKLDKKSKTTSKKNTLTPCQTIVMSLSFFGFLANLEQCRSRIPDTESAKVTLSVKEIFFLTKTENRTKKSLT